MTKITTNPDTHDPCPFFLSEEVRATLIKMGSLRWDAKKICGYFGWNAAEFATEYVRGGSEVRQLLLKGELQGQFEIESKLQTDASSGIPAAVKQYTDLIHDRQFRLNKEMLFGGADDPEIFEQISRYIESGCPGTLDEKTQLGIQLLQLVYSFNVRWGDRKTLRLLTRKPYELSYNDARDLISQAIELFNAGRNTSKASMRHHIAEAYDTIYHAILESATTPQDYMLAAGILDKKAKVLQLDKEDPAILPPQEYARTFRVLSLDPNVLGLPPANRDALGAQIDALPAPDVDKTRLKMEAGVKDVDIVKMLQNVIEEESK